MGTKEKIRKYISEWEKRNYSKGIPDEAPAELEKRGLVPSYRLICIALMKNENNLEILGFQKNKCLAYNELKRIELSNRGDIKQLKLNL